MAYWITHKNVRPNEMGIYEFCRFFDVNSAGNLNVKISAEARYKLYVNDVFIGSGPCKAAENRKYYDEYNLSKYLVCGRNEIKILVLQLQIPFSGGRAFMDSVTRTGYMTAAIEGSVIFDDKKIILDTDEKWLVRRRENIAFIPRGAAHYAGLNEKINFDAAETEFINAVTVTSFEYEGKTADKIIFNRFFAEKRPLPMMKTEKYPLKRQGQYIYTDKPVRGYIKLKLSGKGSVRLTYAECLKSEYITSGEYDRCSGNAFGDYDIVNINGTCIYEPYSLRVFRFIHVQIEGTVKIETAEFISESYPIEFESEYNFGSEKMNKLWDMSVYTLKMCMSDTFEDCPYYERLQYTMDSYLEILFLMRLTDKRELIDKCINDLSNAAAYNGLLYNRYPTTEKEIIPTFSLFFVLMLEAHLDRYGDAEFIRGYMGVMDRILLWFKNNMCEGMVERSAYWNYIDWVKPWENGVPAAKRNAAITVQSMMYARALLGGIKVMKCLGCEGISEAYEKRYAELISAIKEKSFDNECFLFTDCPDIKEYSCHTQIWAVLSGCVNGDEAKKLMKNAMGISVQPTFSFSFFLFRALEKTGMYKCGSYIMDKLLKLTELNCKTVPETPENTRSECHGWSALAIYEYTEQILGVKDTEHGTDILTIKPDLGKNTFAEGSVYTRFGKVHIVCDKKKIIVRGLKGIKKRIIANGKELISDDEKIYIQKE